MSTTITIYIDDITKEELDKVAEKEDRSRSNLVRKIVKDYIKAESSK